MKRRFTDKDIVEIKEKYASGLYSQTEMAEEYHCSVMTISLWLKENPYEIIAKKKRIRAQYSNLPRCELCSRLIHENMKCCDIHDIISRMKPNCAGCGRELRHSVKRMIEQGNFCGRCSSKR